MTDSELLEEQKAVEARFNELSTDKVTKEAELKAVDEELYRLQGEYRAFGKLLPAPNTTDPSSIEVPDSLDIAPSVPEAEIINANKEDEVVDGK